MNHHEYDNRRHSAPRQGSQIVKGFDAIVMAGDRVAAQPIRDTNKAFLEIRGIPLICYVLSALEQSRYVSRIFVVGPKAKIEEALGKPHSPIKKEKPVLVIEQWDTLLENAWNTFLVTLEEGSGETTLPEEELRRRYGDKVALVVGADMPLLTPYEVDEFIEGCNLDRYDFIVGITREEVLKPYYPVQGRPGIKLSYFIFKDSLERQNNLNMIRFFKITNREYVEKMYRNRYQRKWQNIIRVAWIILRMPEMTLGIIFSFILLHLARILESLGLRRLRRIVCLLLNKETMERYISRLLKARFGSVATHYGGAALDVDNAEQLHCIEINFDSWKRHQEELHQQRSKASSSVFDSSMRETLPG